MIMRPAVPLRRCWRAEDYASQLHRQHTHIAETRSKNLLACKLASEYPTSTQSLQQQKCVLECHLTGAAKATLHLSGTVLLHNHKELVANVQEHAIFAIDLIVRMCHAKESS